MKAHVAFSVFICTLLTAPLTVAQHSAGDILYKRTDGLNVGGDDFTGALPDNTDTVAPFGVLDDPGSSIITQLNVNTEGIAPTHGIDLSGDNFDLAFTFQFYDDDGAFSFTENFDDRVQINITPIVGSTNFTATGAPASHADVAWDVRTFADFSFGAAGWFDAQIWLTEDGGGAQSAAGIGFGYSKAASTGNEADYALIGGGAVFDTDGNGQSFGSFINSFDPSVDTDGDGIPDGYEEQFFPGDLTKLGDPGDFDNDGVSDLDEFKDNTNPTKADTDDDGSDDGQEKAAGTDPLDPDSDDDGLLDGVETNTGIFVSASDTGTDPLNPDTDGDLTPDGQEVLLPGRNPNIADRPPTDFSTDLVAYWPQDGDHNNVYSILTDDYHGTVDGPPIPFDTGLFGEAAHLDGSHSIIIGGNPADLTFAGQSMSVAAWFTADVIDTSWQAVIAKGEGNSWRMHRRGADNPPQIAWTGGNGDTPVHATPITVGGNPETWHHVVGVTDSETQIEILYIDGVEVARQTGAVLTANSANPVRIGENPDALNRRWKGKIDDVAIWNRALGPDEIAVLHGSGLAGTSLGDLLFGAGLNPLGLAVRNVGGQLEFSWNSSSGNLYDLVSNLGLESEIESWPAFGAHTAMVATPDRNTLTIPYPADPERYFAIKCYPVPPVKAFSDDFEGGQGSWVTADSGVPFPPNLNPSSPTDTKWELGPPDAGVAGGPPAAHSGANCFGTDLDAAYVEDTGISLTSPPIDLTGIVGATLVYWRYTDIETTFDFGKVRLLDAANDSEIAVLEDTIDGTITEWEEVRIDLPAEAAGKSVKIEFTFASDNFNTNPQAGLYLDDVCVEAVPE